MPARHLEGLNHLVRQDEPDVHRAGADLRPHDPAVSPDNTNMKPVSVGGEGRYVALMSPQDEFNMRTVDTAGWLDMNKALTQGGDKSNPIFKGGLGMLANTILHSHESVVRFSDYGAGANLPASRSLFMGRQAAMIAYGTGPDPATSGSRSATTTAT